MPCYSVTPAYRRNVVHYNPFFNPVQHSFSIVPVSRYAPAPASLFRSFEEDFAQFDSFFKEVDASLAAATKKTRSFQPRFDIKEESDRFVLNGELPGVQPENLSIEFVDRNTMAIKGKVIRTETHGTPPAEKQQEQSQQPEQTEQASSEDVTMSGALPDTASEASVSSSNYHKASVEDEDAGENATASTTEAAATPAPAEDQVAKSTPQEVSKTTQPESHYWVSERTVGEFSRSFDFPGKINQDKVKASLKDGILTVAVPKQAEQDGRRKINVEA